MVPEKEAFTIYFKKGYPIDVKSIFNWLGSEVGTDNWNYWTHGSSYQLNFRYEEDKIKFILRWI